MPAHTAVVPAWRGEGRKGVVWGRRRERHSGSLTCSAAAYGDETDVKTMIGDDGEAEKERVRDRELQSPSIRPTFMGY